MSTPPSRAVARALASATGAAGSSRHVRVPGLKAIPPASIVGPPLLAKPPQMTASCPVHAVAALYRVGPGATAKGSQVAVTGS